ncbi:MAG TPA: DUF1670 domain-containing protein [Thermodesulfobacteriota bacterium]
MTVRSPAEPRVGQLKISGVLSSEPAGKPLRDCARGECFVTYDAGEEDEETRRRHGVIGLRRFKLLRIATEAHDQGIDLTQEGLAKILGAGVKTVKRDIAYFRKHGIFLPTRGQQKDLGPIVPHQVEAVRLTLDGLDDWEVSRRILHSPGMVGRIIGSFARVVAFLREGRDPEDIAYLVDVPLRLVDEYRRVAAEAAADPARQARLEALVARHAPGPADEAAAGTGGENGAQPREGQGRRRPPLFDEQVKVLRREVFEFLFDLEVRKATRYKLPVAVVAIEAAAGDGPTQAGRTLASMTLAEHLREQVRATDVIGRAAVSRFYILLPVADVPAAQGFVQRLLRDRNIPPQTRIVAGAACFPAHGSRASELLRESERALGTARATGRAFAFASDAFPGSNRAVEPSAGGGTNLTSRAM